MALISEKRRKILMGRGKRREKESTKNIKDEEGKRKIIKMEKHEDEGNACQKRKRRILEIE